MEFVNALDYPRETSALFREYTEQLVDYGFVHKTADGKYWVDGN